MPKLNTDHHDDLHDRQGKTVNDLLNDSERSFDGTLDFSICGGRQIPVEDSDVHPERTSVAEQERVCGSTAHQRLLPFGSPA